MAKDYCLLVNNMMINQQQPAQHEQFALNKLKKRANTHLNLEKGRSSHSVIDNYQSTSQYQLDTRSKKTSAQQFLNETLASSRTSNHMSGLTSAKLNSNRKSNFFRQETFPISDRSITKGSINSNVYSSFLTYGSINPFTSNFDLLNKDNADFYKKMLKSNGSIDVSARFNRANSSLSIMAYQLEYDKFNKLIENNKFLTKLTNADFDEYQIKNEKLNHQDTEYDADEMADANLTMRPDDKNQDELNEINIIYNKENLYNNSNTMENFSFRNRNLNSKLSFIDDSKSVIKTQNSVKTNKLDKITTKNFLLEKQKTVISSKNQDSSSSALTKNLFLNYRNNEQKPTNNNNRQKAKNNQNNVFNSYKIQNNNTNDNKSDSNGKAKPENYSKLDDQLFEYRIHNGPEKYLETHKLNEIRKWLQNVEKVQAIEGKFTETINKIPFYD